MPIKPGVNDDGDDGEVFALPKGRRTAEVWATSANQPTASSTTGILDMEPIIERLFAEEKIILYSAQTREKLCRTLARGLLSEGGDLICKVRFAICGAINDYLRNSPLDIDAKMASLARLSKIKIWLNGKKIESVNMLFGENAANANGGKKRRKKIGTPDRGLN
jgi:hypothetical protein